MSIKTAASLKNIIYSSAILLLASLSLVNGCSWSGPYPGITVNSEGLGQGQIARYLNGSWMNSEKWIASKVSEMLVAANVNQEHRSSAESIGMVCSPQPTKVCKYVGVVRHEPKAPASVAPEHSKLHVTNISIVLPNYDDPSAIIVQKTELIPE